MTTQEIIDQMTELQTRNGTSLPVTVDMFQDVMQIVAYQSSAIGVSRSWCVDIRTNLYSVSRGIDRENELARETVKEVIGALKEITTRQGQIISQLRIACETNDFDAVLAGVRRLTGLDEPGDSTPES